MIVKLKAKDKQLLELVKRMLDNNEAALIVDKDLHPLVKMIPVPKPIGRYGRFPVYRKEDIQYLQP